MPRAAERLGRRILKAVSLLELFPERGWQVREERYAGFREIVVKRFRILYRIDGHGVLIERIIHGSRNLGDIFSKDE